MGSGADLDAAQVVEEAPITSAHQCLSTWNRREEVRSLVELDGSLDSILLLGSGSLFHAVSTASSPVSQSTLLGGHYFFKVTAAVCR